MLSLLLFSILTFAKDLIGDPLVTPSGSLFPEESAVYDQLNSLHTRSSASLKGPIFNLEEPSFPIEKWQIQSPKDDFRKLMEVYSPNLPVKTNIFEIDAAGLSSGKIKTELWSYHFFPVYKGGAAERFLNPLFNESEDWDTLFNEYKNYSPQLLISQGKAEQLSPMEKYEYLVGNSSFSLTQAQWKLGIEAKKKFGIIPTWYGSCHGTAPASIRSPRPEHTISVRSFDNSQEIQFTPSDIKILLSYAWATSASESAMIGTRCEEILYPDRRPSPSCNDVNPGAFHLAVINLLGLYGEPIIIDTAESIQVWNRPLVSYRFSYFRPDTKYLTSNLKSAILPREKFLKDPFKIYRSPQATSIVGVWIELNFIAGISASGNPVNSSSDDTYLTTSYWYDLELDSAGNIVGGEWREIFHPDFLWVVAPQLKPYTLADRQIGSGLRTYDGKKPLDNKVIELAKKSSNTGEVLFTLLEKMLELAHY